MEYPTDRHYIQDGQPIPNQYVCPSSAFTSRLSVLDHQYQHQRPRQQGPLGFDSTSSTPPSTQSYNNGMQVSDSYGSLQLGNYDTSSIIDWNNSTRSLNNSIDSQFGATPGLHHGNAGIFQPANTNEWSNSLRGAQQNGLSMQLNNSNNNNLQSYNLSDLTQFHSQQIALSMSNDTAVNAQNQRNSSGPSRYTPTGQSRQNYVGATSPSPTLQTPGTGGSNAQGRALNKMLLDILRDRMIDPNRLAMAIDANIERMDCVNLATLLFHTGKKRLLLTPSFIKRIAIRFSTLKEELRAREASNALYGLKCMSSECLEVRQLVFALASKLAVSQTDLVAQAVGNALYGCQMMTSEHEEVRYLLHMLSIKIALCTELLEAQNVGNALYGLRGMNSDCKEVRMVVAAITPKVATAREELNGQALGNSLYGLQGMNSREPEIRNLLSVLAIKVSRTWEDLKAQEVGNALYGLKRMNSDVPEVRNLVEALVPKVASSPEILDAQAIGNSFYGMQNMKSDNQPVLSLLATMADKVLISPAELDGQAMGNSLYGLQGMKSEQPQVRAVVNAITIKIQASMLEMNAQELGNALYGLQNMSCDYPEVRRLLIALTQKVSSSKHELTSQEIGNAIFGLQNMRSDCREVRQLVRQMATKIQQSSSLIDPQGIANSLFGLQHMTSDKEEVRMLISALTAKIELSWKVLSSQHVSNSLFGLQGLNSSDIEVRTLVHSLVPKVLACRDMLTPKQICHAIFGLKNMFSHHDEVRSMLGPLTEKLVLCTDVMPLQLLSLAFYGLQGMDSSFEEVLTLLTALCEKLSSVDEIDAFSIANIMFGFQRMSTTVTEVRNALELLSPMVMTLADAGLEIGAQVCANLIYGLQNCSCEEESVRRILFVVLSFVKDLINGLSAASTATGSNLSNFSDAICIHQAISLSLQVLPGLETDSDLSAEIRSIQEQIYLVIDSRKAEVTPYKLSVVEKRLADTIIELLSDEPFVVTVGELLHGFESCITIRLRPGLKLMTVSGVEWSPVLNIEIPGPHDSCPREELFNRLRTQYLFQEKGVVVQTIPFATISGQSRSSLRELLRSSNDLFNALYPPTVEDANNFNSILKNMGVIKEEGILSSLSSGNRYPLETPNIVTSDNVSSFFSLGSGDVDRVSVSDDFDQLSAADEAADYFDSKNSKNGANNGPFRVQQSNHIAVGWIGDMPVVSISSHTTPTTSPIASYSALSNRRSPLSSKVYKMVSTSPMPPGYSARAVYPPFVQIGPPIQSPSTVVTPSPVTSPRHTISNGSSKQLHTTLQSPTTIPVNVKPPQVSYTIPSAVKTCDSKGSGASSALSLDSDISKIEEVIISTPATTTNTNTATTITSIATTTVLSTDHIIENTEEDGEIAFLEAQLEIKRLEAKLLMLKKAKKNVNSATQHISTQVTDDHSGHDESND